MISSKIFLRKTAACSVFFHAVAQVILLLPKFLAATNFPILKDNIQIIMFFHLSVKDAFGKMTMLRKVCLTLILPQKIYVLLSFTKSNGMGYKFSCCRES
jgi:hypothetical protein